MTNSSVDVQDQDLFSDFPEAKPDETQGKFFEAPSEQAPLPSNVCPNCLATSRNSKVEYCEECGYYARFGLVVGGKDETIEEKEFPISSIGAMAAAFTVVGLFNMAVLFYTPQGSPERTWWSVSQLFVGLFGVVLGHTYCFLQTMNNNDTVRGWEIVVSPTIGWIESAGHLPKRLWAFVVAVGGLTAVLGSVLVLRGIPYDYVFTLIPTVERQELASAIIIAESEQQASGNKTLEEALLMFSDEGAEPPLSFLEEPERLYKDAIVIAYWTDSIGIVDRVLLAGAIDGKLQQLGMADALPEGARKKLTRVLPKLRRSTPFLSSAADPLGDGEVEDSESTDGETPGDASDESDTQDSNVEPSAEDSTGDDGSAKKGSGINWVQPRWLCRISYVETSEGIPTDMQFHWVVRRLIRR